MFFFSLQQYVRGDEYFAYSTSRHVWEAGPLCVDYLKVLTLQKSIQCWVRGDWRNERDKEGSGHGIFEDCSGTDKFSEVA
jgi:hypothetical protein